MANDMKKILVLCAVMLTFTACTPDKAKGVLRQSREKCQSIQHGHYVVEHWKKFMSSNDTIMTRYTCDFKKLPDDSVYGKAFALFAEGSNGSSHNLYTGNEYVWFNDSIGDIMSYDRCADEIIAVSQNCTFYTVLTDTSNYPIPSEEDMADNAYSYSITETMIDGKPCYMVDILQKMDEELGGLSSIKCIRYEVELWIDKKDYLPMQYSIAYDIVNGRDTMYQYDLFKLLAFDTVLDESRLTLESIPAEVILKDYVPYEEPEPLAEGTQAPYWSLPTLAGDTVHLAGLKGKVVLVDFFYKSCAPCCAALPALQSLHEKYKDKGFVMIGIDPFDNPQKDQMEDFLSKRDITYTVLFSDRELPGSYHVNCYPTLFFLDRKGKIVKIQEGFSTTLEEALEEQLLKML